VWFCRDSLRKARNHLIFKAERLEVTLQRRANDPRTPKSERESLRRIGSLRSVVSTWLARETLRLLRMAENPSDQVVADFHAWISGERVTRHTIRRCREQIQKHIDRP
jgi:hypothetical protein